MVYDKVIIGAGLYGLYSAELCGKQGDNVLVIECDDKPFSRATYINQARVHMGYHYPRSFSTAIKSANYFERFVNDYGFCILTDFDKIYATSKNFSWTNAKQFEGFCDSANIKCERINPEKYFKSGMCDGAFLTQEYTYDANMLRDYFTKKLSQYSNVTIKYNTRITDIKQCSDRFDITLSDSDKISTDFLINTTYASTNQISTLAGFEPFEIKYELCEIILCKPSDKLKNVGITVMDGPFFSIMPFGKTGYHSLTSVTFTPHKTSYSTLPEFECQAKSKGKCSKQLLYNCNLCPAKPHSAWDYMSGMAKKYLKEEYSFEYSHSLFSIKPILKASEIDDSRPTMIKKHSDAPTFISVLSGKINTVYDLDEVLTNGR